MRAKKLPAINRLSLKDRMRSYLRHPFSFICMLLVMLGALLTVGVLFALIFYILVNGIPYLKPELFSLTYNSENASMFPAIINTITMTLLSLLIAVPFSVFTAIYLVEYAKRGNKLVGVIRTTAETLSGIPSIVYGLFGMLFFVTYLGWGTSLLAGAMTLSIMILPLIMRVNGGGASRRTRFLSQRAASGLGAGQAAHCVQSYSAACNARHSGRHYTGGRPYCRGDSRSSLHLRYNGKNSGSCPRSSCHGCGTHACRTYVYALRRGPSYERGERNRSRIAGCGTAYQYAVKLYR